MKVIKIFFIILINIILFVIAAVIGLSLFLNFKYDINIITTIRSVNKVDSSYVVETDVTASDKNRFNEIYNDNENIDSLTDKYVAAYFRTMTLDDEFELITLDLDDNELTSIVKFDTTNLLNQVDKYKSIKKHIPNPMYVSVTSKIEVVDNNAYNVEAVSMKFQNLNNKETKNLCNIIKLASKEYGYNALNKKINGTIVDFIYNGSLSGSIYSLFKTKGCTSFGLDTTGDKSYFTFYYVSLDEKWTITYNDLFDVNNPNILEYNITLGTYNLTDLSRKGYNFLGFYEGTNKITTINGSDARNYVLTAKWEIITYEINYTLNGGTVSGSNPETYTVEDEITIINPTKEFAEFVGWNNGEETILNYVIERGSIGNINLYAIYQGEVNTITLMGDGIKLASFEMNRGEALTDNIVEEAFHDNGLLGYSVSYWYKDSLMSTVYNNEALNSDTVLYGSLNYFVNNISFYDYLEQFNHAVSTSSTLNITSEAMLKAYIEYVIFYNLKKSINLNITYTSAPGVISTLYNNYKTNADRFINNSSVSYSSSTFYVSNSVVEDQAKNTMDPTKSMIYTQQDYAFSSTFVQTRANDFDEFSVNLVAKSLPVTTSTQLFYVLENGYRPVCSGDLLVLYNKILNILRQNIDDEMDDVEKLDQIYQWLIKNVAYDNKALDEVEHGLTTQQALTYKSWFIEGVIDDGVAVCEGIAKTLLTMAKIEGIPALYVTGNGHAWNKVYVDGAWYGIDATHGNLGINMGTSKQFEVYSYTQFMFTDSYKTSLSYPTTNHPDKICNTVFDYFEYKKYSFLLGEFSLKIGSSNISKFALYVKNRSKTTYYLTVSIELEDGYSIEDFESACSIRGLTAKSHTIPAIKTTAGLDSYVVFF